MLRPIAAGWMCLGFVTLGVAATWGQDEGGKPENVDATVVEQAAGEAAPASDAAVPVKEGDLRRIEIRIGEDGAAAIVGEGEKRAEVREGGEVIVVEGKDGKVVQRIPVNPQYAPIQARVRLAGPAVVDPGTREALEKLIAGLNDEVKKLESEGKKEEVEKKQQSIRALEQILNPVPHWAASARQLMPREGAMFGRRARSGAGGRRNEEAAGPNGRVAGADVKDPGGR